MGAVEKKTNFNLRAQILSGVTASSPSPARSSSPMPPTIYVTPPTAALSPGGAKRVSSTGKIVTAASGSNSQDLIMRHQQDSAADSERKGLRRGHSDSGVGEELLGYYGRRSVPTLPQLAAAGIPNGEKSIFCQKILIDPAACFFPR